ncbi:MAG: hypothetical protein ACT4QC_14055 [Planctomycetaceae bacterium]
MSTLAEIEAAVEGGKEKQQLLLFGKGQWLDGGSALADKAFDSDSSRHAGPALPGINFPGALFPHPAVYAGPPFVLREPVALSREQSGRLFRPPAPHRSAGDGQAARPS